MTIVALSANYGNYGKCNICNRDSLTMLNFGKLNHDKLFKQKKLYLATRVNMNTW